MEKQFLKKSNSFTRAGLVFCFSMLLSGPVIASNECFPIQGKFKSYNLPAIECGSPVGFCTRGVLSGGLWGDYDFVAQQFIPANEQSVPAVNFFTGFSYVYTRRGNLRFTDTGALNMATGKISALLTVTEGSGDFEQAIGHLYVKGVADADTNSNIGRYEGEVCIPKS